MDVVWGFGLVPLHLCNHSFVLSPTGALLQLSMNITGPHCTSPQPLAASTHVLTMLFLVFSWIFVSRDFSYFFYDLRFAFKKIGLISSSISRCFVARWCSGYGVYCFGRTRSMSPMHALFSWVCSPLQLYFCLPVSPPPPTSSLIDLISLCFPSAQTAIISCLAFMPVTQFLAGPVLSLSVSNLLAM